MAVNKNNVKIHVSHLKKNFGHLEVIKDISTDIYEGEVVVILGPSGSGKSTFLRCINRLEEPTGGEIIVDGQAITDKKADLNKIRENIGMVFQHFNLFNNLNVIQNLMLAPVQLKKASKEKAKEEAMSMLKKVGLEDKANAYPCELSGGQKQRVAIARALALSPDILFFDEPTSALDPELTGEILKVIKDLSAADMTMVIVTHEMAFARDVSDRIVFMDGGVVIESGYAKDVINNPKNERTRLFLSKFSQ